MTEPYWPHSINLENFGMPVKKIQPKSKKTNAKKKASKIKTSVSNRKEIKKAVGELPELILEEMREERIVQDPLAPAYIHSTARYQEEPHSGRYIQTKKRLLWFGVSTLTLLILGLWAFTMHDAVNGLTLSQSSEASLMGTIQQDFTEIFNNQQTNLLGEPVLAPQEEKTDASKPNVSPVAKVLGTKLIQVLSSSSTVPTSTQDEAIVDTGVIPATQ